MEMHFSSEKSALAWGLLHRPLAKMELRGPLEDALPQRGSFITTKRLGGLLQESLNSVTERAREGSEWKGLTKEGRPVPLLSILICWDLYVVRSDLGKGDSAPPAQRHFLNCS